jgi:hypothetical protein
MSDLAQQQELLLDALFAWPAQDATKKLAAHAIGSGARGLKAYQTNGHMSAERALLAAYPVVAQIIGLESFADLARALWHAHPPLRGDLAQWGDTLSSYLRSSSQLQDTPYLTDVARVEWSLHVAATAVDGVADPTSLALLTTDDPAELTLALSGGCTAIQSDWPTASILSAHLEGTPSFAEVGQQLNERIREDVVVWRNGLRPCSRQALPGECACLQALSEGRSLAQALDDAPALDFSAWFPRAFQTGLVLAVAKSRSR